MVAPLDVVAEVEGQPADDHELAVQFHLLSTVFTRSESETCGCLEELQIDESFTSSRSSLANDRLLFDRVTAMPCRLRCFPASAETPYRIGTEVQPEGTQALSQSLLLRQLN